MNKNNLQKRKNLLALKSPQKKSLKAAMLPPSLALEHYTFVEVSLSYCTFNRSPLEGPTFKTPIKKLLKIFMRFRNIVSIFLQFFQRKRERERVRRGK